MPSATPEGVTGLTDHEDNHLGRRTRNIPQYGGPRPAAGSDDRWARGDLHPAAGRHHGDQFLQAECYDPSDNKIGDVDDVLIDKEGRITAMIIGVGGFLGMGEKDVAVPFSSVRASEKNNKWYLVLNTNKEALKTAPGFTYDKTKQPGCLPPNR
jgi:sporulation protein YlmC with PRC-barrel domain